MSTLKIKGGVKLRGHVPIYGMKNAALPCVAATLLTNETVTLRNVPRITDLLNMLEILKSLGARVSWLDESTLSICCKNINLHSLDKGLVKSMRSSVLLLGPMLVRFRELMLAEPGGCILGNRPLDDHISVFKGFGCEIHRKDGGLHFATRGLQGNNLFARFSVTATENALMAGAGAQGTSQIRLAAAEPHVVNLADMLKGMGAKIKGDGTSTIHVEGVSNLSGVDHTIIPDQLEIGTFIAAAAATRGDITMAPVVKEHLDAVFALLEKIKIPYEVKGDSLHVMPNGSLKSFKLQTGLYPAFPTDLQALFGVVATQASGTSLIHDPLYEGRLGYINELIKMGANAVICDPHRVLVTGPTPLYAREIRSLDIRAGATMVIAGLTAEGETTISDAHILERGYYKLDERLVNCGAEITRNGSHSGERVFANVETHQYPTSPTV